jgi:hypothetical protein
MRLVDALGGDLELVLRSEDVPSMPVRVRFRLAKVRHEVGRGKDLAQAGRVAHDLAPGGVFRVSMRRGRGVREGGMSYLMVASSFFSGHHEPAAMMLLLPGLTGRRGCQHPCAGWKVGARTRARRRVEKRKGVSSGQSV